MRPCNLSDFREIPLTQGQIALVDAEDYERLSSHKWYAHWEPKTGTFYAARNRSRTLGRCVLWMHREILGLDVDDPRTGDHALHLTLDNRKFIDGRPNLRIATLSQQQHNHKMQRNNTSGFKGVTFDRSKGKYAARLKMHGVTRHLGYRTTANAASLLVVAERKRLHTDFACNE